MEYVGTFNEKSIRAMLFFLLLPPQEFPKFVILDRCSQTFEILIVAGNDYSVLYHPGSGVPVIIIQFLLFVAVPSVSSHN